MGTVIPEIYWGNACERWTVRMDSQGKPQTTAPWKERGKEASVRKLQTTAQLLDSLCQASGEQPEQFPHEKVQCWEGVSPTNPPAMIHYWLGRGQAPTLTGDHQSAMLPEAGSLNEIWVENLRGHHNLRQELSPPCPAYYIRIKPPLCDVLPLSASWFLGMPFLCYIYSETVWILVPNQLPY